jgi:hypothetical protein
LLASGWLNVGQDPVDGNQQKNATFWGRVEKYFHEHRTFESDRNWSSLKHIWGIFKKEVSIFQGFHESVERRNESDKISNDKVNQYLFYFSLVTLHEGSDFLLYCCCGRLSKQRQCFSSYKRRHFVCSKHGTPFTMGQSGQPNENLGMAKIIMKLSMVQMKLTPMLKGHHEERLRRRRENIQILMLILSSRS